jgi:hypothetical protein
LSQVPQDVESRVAMDVPRTLRLETAVSLDQLGPHAEAWDNLAEHSASRIPTSSYAWVSSCLEHLLEPDEPWLCLFAYDGPDLVGVLPVVSGNGSRTMETSARLSILTSAHAFSIDFLSRQGREDEVIPFLLTALQSCCPGWSELRCSRLSERSPTRTVLAGPSNNHLWVTTMQTEGSYIHAVGSFDAYWSRLDKSFARNLQRFVRKIEDVDGFEVQFLTGADAKPEIIEQFAAVEASGWKGREGSAILKSEKLMRFYTSLTRRLAARGWLEWHLLRAEDRTIGCHLAVRLGSVVCLWKIAFDEEYQRFAPGNVLLLSAFRRAFMDSTIDEVDCLTDSKWNVNWKMWRRSYYYLTIWPRKPLAVLGGYVPAKARVLIRDIPGARSVWKRVRAFGNKSAEKKP